MVVRRAGDDRHPSGENLADRFLAAAGRHPERTAVVVAGSDPARLSYADLAARVHRLAAFLQAQGIGPGDRVGVLLANGNEHLEALLAGFLLRAVPVNLSLRDTSEETGAILQATGAGFVIREPDADPCGRPSLARGEPYEDALRRATSGPVVEGRSGADEYLLCTGGATGRPKAVVWRHRDLLHAALVPAGLGRPGAARAVPCLPASPFAHGTGQWMALSTLLEGATVVCRRDRSLDPEALLDTVDAESVSHLTIVGDAFALPLVQVLDACRSRWSLSSLTAVLSGGAPLSPSSKRSLLALLPTLVVVDGFGSSETGGHGRMVSVAGAVQDGPPRFRCDDDTAVLDDDLRPIPPGDVRTGFVARRNRVPIGYDGDTAATARAFPTIDGVRWALSGDRARHEADGTITVLGRGATTINTGGHKVQPEEVERCLRSHPAIEDAVVVGVPDERFGERVTAIVSAHHHAAPTLENVHRHCRSVLAPHKIPRRLVVVDRVRRSDAGKPDYVWARTVAGG